MTKRAGLRLLVVIAGGLVWIFHSSVGFAQSQDPVESLVAEAQRWVKEGRLDEAEKVLKRGLQDQRQSLSALHQSLAAVYLFWGRLEEMREQLLAAERLDTQDPDIYSSLAYYHLLTGDFQTARERAQKALQMEPRHAEARVALLLSLLYTGKAEEVLVLVSSPDSTSDPRMLFAFGTAYRLLGRREEAQRYWGQARALRLNPAMKQQWECVKQSLTLERTPSVDIYWRSDLPSEQKAKVRQVVESTFERLTQRFGSRPSQRVAIVLCPDENTFRASRLSEEEYPASGGWYGEGQIFIPPEEGLKRVRLDFETVITHELTHFFVHTLSQELAPLWLSEGLAQQEYWGVRTRSSNSEPLRLFQKMLEKGQTFPLVAMERSSIGPYMSTIQFYWVSRFLVERYGYGKISDFLRQVGEGRQVEQALHSAFGLTYEGLEKRWKEFARAQLKELPTAPKQKQ